MDEQKNLPELITDGGIICPLCSSGDCHYSFQQFDLWNERHDVQAVYYSCHSCGFLFQSPIIYYRESVGKPQKNYSPHNRIYDIIHKHGLLARCRVVTQRKRRGHILDIGSGDGDFLNCMIEDFKWQGTGVEVNKSVALSARERFGLDIRNCSIEDANFPYGYFDVITMWDSLEHLDKPASILQTIHTWLKDEGLLIIRVPNLDSNDARLFGSSWAGIDAPRHISVFRPSTLDLILSVNGYQIVASKSNIGNYLNFVKSIIFWLTERKVNNRYRVIIERILKSILMRMIAYPIWLIRDRNLNGSEMVIVAAKISNPINE